MNRDPGAYQSTTNRDWLIGPWERRLYSKLKYFQTHITDGYFDHFLRNSPQLNATRPQCWLVKIGTGKGLVICSAVGVTRPQWGRDLSRCGQLEVHYVRKYNIQIKKAGFIMNTNKRILGLVIYWICYNPSVSQMICKVSIPSDRKLTLVGKRLM